jgi:hypothetical protein
MAGYENERPHKQSNCWCNCGDAEHYYSHGLTGVTTPLSVPRAWEPGHACHSCERQLIEHLRNSRYANTYRHMYGRDLSEDELQLLVMIGITDTPGPAN